jgi:hypothetical protein
MEVMKARALNTSRPLVHVYLYENRLACGKIMRGDQWEIIVKSELVDVTCKKCLRACNMSAQAAGEMLDPAMRITDQYEADRYLRHISERRADCRVCKFIIRPPVDTKEGA